jgi:peptide chain release factor subunit 1
MTCSLVLYCGTVITAEGKEKKVSIDFEPFKRMPRLPLDLIDSIEGGSSRDRVLTAAARALVLCVVCAAINTSLYLCDNKFHTEALKELLESDQKFGFIVMDGNGTLFGTLSGNTRTVLHKFAVDLPKKHGRGGQSALRFARLRMEKRHNYLRKVAELSTQLFISNDRTPPSAPSLSPPPALGLCLTLCSFSLFPAGPNIAGLVLAGSAEFKSKVGSCLASPCVDSGLS